MSRERGEQRKLAIRALSVVYLIALVAALAWLVIARGDDLLHLFAGARPAFIAGAAIVGIAQIGVNALLWSVIVRGLGQRLPWGTSLRTTARSLPARYLPGGVWLAVGRAGLLAHEGVPRRTLATTAVIEAAGSLVVAGGFGGLLLVATGNVGGNRAIALGVAVGVALVAAPIVLRTMLARRRPGVSASVSAYIRVVVAFLVFWIVAAGAFTIYLHAFPALELGSAIETAGAYMVSWSAGFLAVFAPQGAGVTEVTLASLLSPGDIAEFAVVAGGYRLLLLIRDLGAAMIAIVGSNGSPRQEVRVKAS